MLRDPELIAEAQKGEWAIEPVSGEELQSLAERFMVQSPDVVKIAGESVAVMDRDRTLACRLLPRVILPPR